MKKNFLLTLITACMPGFGQMYYGYMRRGFSLALYFWVGMGVSVLLESPLFMFLLIALWGYAFFDTFRLRNWQETLPMPKDDYVPPFAFWKTGLGGFPKTNGAFISKAIGWGLVVVGSLLLVRSIFADYWYEFVYFSAFGSIVRYLPLIALCIGMIVLGVRILRGNREDKSMPVAPSQENNDPGAPPLAGG